MRTQRTIALTVGLLLPTISTGYAQEAPTTAPDAAAVEFNDVVRLKDGSKFIGRIVAMVPSEQVTLQMPGGGVRTFSMAEVLYAGPIAGDDNPAVSVTSRDTLVEGGQRVSVQIDAKQPELELELVEFVGESRGVAQASNGTTVVAVAQSYRSLCELPCRIQVPSGKTRLGLRKGEGGVVLADPLRLNEDSKLEAEFVDRSTGRLVTGLVSLAGIAAGGTMTIMSLTQADEDFDSTLLIAGTSTMVGSGLLSLLVNTFVFPDEARLTPITF